jgi:hypothetical protein
VSSLETQTRWLLFTSEKKTLTWSSDMLGDSPQASKGFYAMSDLIARVDWVKLYEGPPKVSAGLRDREHLVHATRRY